MTDDGLAVGSVDFRLHDDTHLVGAEEPSSCLINLDVLPQVGCIAWPKRGDTPKRPSATIEQSLVQRPAEF